MSYACRVACQESVHRRAKRVIPSPEGRGRAVFGAGEGAPIDGLPDKPPSPLASLAPLPQAGDGLVRFAHRRTVSAFEVDDRSSTLADRSVEASGAPFAVADRSVQASAGAFV